MLVEEIVEGFVQIFGRNKGKVVRRYRCTSGSRRGRIVASPKTCTAPKNVKAKMTMKATRRRKGSTMGIRAGRTKRTNPASQKLKRLNIGKRTIKPRRRPGTRSKI
jgi:hypothetical protein